MMLRSPLPALLLAMAAVHPASSDARPRCGPTPAEQQELRAFRLTDADIAAALRIARARGEANLEAVPGHPLCYTLGRAAQEVARTSPATARVTPGEARRFVKAMVLIEWLRRPDWAAELSPREITPALRASAATIRRNRAVIEAAYRTAARP